jgi:hypothetical protein
MIPSYIIGHTTYEVKKRIVETGIFKVPVESVDIPETSEKPFVVFEHNIRFHEDFGKLFPLYLEQIPKDYDVVFLGAEFENSEYNIDTLPVHSAFATLISPSGAKKYKSNDPSLKYYVINTFPEKTHSLKHNGLVVCDGSIDYTFEIVISRFNEDLNWLKNAPFNRHKIICYNKSDNDNFYKPDNMIVHKLPNLGRETHTYLYHIMNNYNNLPDTTIFLPGSGDYEAKIENCTQTVLLAEKYQRNVFLGNYNANVRNYIYNFTIDRWDVRHPLNNSKNKESYLEPAIIRPYGKWYDHHFGDTVMNYVNWCGIFAITKKTILQHGIEHYKPFYDELSVGKDLEAVHYIERSWNAIFHPMEQTIYNAEYDKIRYL